MKKHQLAAVCAVLGIALTGCAGKRNNDLISSVTGSRSLIESNSTLNDSPAVSETTSNKAATKSVIRKTDKTTTSAVKEVQSPAMVFAGIAQKALDDLYRHFWTEKDGGHFIDTHGEKEEVKKFTAFWCSSIAVFCLQNYYEATGDLDTKNRIALQWQHILNSFNEEQLTGLLGRAPNTAADDAGWDALYYIRMYEILGDKKALQYAGKLVRNSFEHWKDGDLSNGMWYSDYSQYNEQWKSVYCGAHVLVALKYSELTKGTEYYDQKLYDDAMKLYTWIENNLRRDKVVTYEDGLQSGKPYTIDTIDYLYWTDFNVNRKTRVEKNGPDGGTRPNDITDNGSVSSLFGNMMMASINAILYRTTGNDQYRVKAVQTANSMSKIYNKGGSFINDRDANVNATFYNDYIKEVLPLKGISEEAKELVKTTALNIYNDCRTAEGYYKVCWRKLPPGFSCLRDVQKHYEYMQVSATSVTMITGAALAEKLGIIRG